ncbi:hypothetical protein DWX10_17030 [Clostridium sp. AF18-27]|uniref:hypothetical protein n=1 Tax=Enterocloster lavalensis TaxID=460384 RepID=UPI000E54A51E|nr:hypothetical protein [Enterocloster lavalensis]RHR52115.1 hypothetical protein DWX10_17030 [Clostridium sp. AF18-27]
MQVGITFDKQLLTSRQHAHFQRLFLHSTDGITKGCEVSQSGNNVYVQKGFFVISGRFVEVTGVETIETPPVTSGTLYCKVVYEVDLSKTNTESNFTQGQFKTLTNAAGYPSITQEDLDDNGTIYQMPFCQYTKTTEAVGSFRDIRPIFDIVSVWAAISGNNATYKEEFDRYFSDQSAAIEQMIADLQDQGYLLIAREREIIPISLLASGWSESAPYTQTIAVEGITIYDTPVPLLDVSGASDFSNEKLLRKQYGWISYYDTANGQITFTASFRKPTVDLAIGLKGV